MANLAHTLSRWISSSAVALVVTLVAIPPPSLAQTIRSTLTGTVTDPNHAVVANATVTATHVATNVESTTRTNDEGLYWSQNFVRGFRLQAEVRVATVTSG